MHRYIPNTEVQKKEMLSAIGMDNFEDLFHIVPRDVKLGRALDLPIAMSEMEVAAHMRSLSGLNKNLDDNICFLGAGAYDHYIPSVIDHLLLRQEFYTAYTPYQPEISQGTLQAIFEYQSMICMLTGMDVANASTYDGGSALAEAAMMSCVVTHRNEVLVVASVHPESRAVLATYAHFRGIKIIEFGYTDGMADMTDLESKISDDTAAVIIQTPNFFGIIEDLREAEKMAHANKSLLIASCDPISLAIIESPGQMGADIAVGEGQALGNSLSFGGPYLGFFAVKEKYLRKMPGRIVGQTVDKNDNVCYVLTIQTREQHIRREKATSNICSNEALNALTATIYLTAMGKNGLRDVAMQCINKSHYAYKRLLDTGKFYSVFNAPFIKEFAVEYRGDVNALNNRLASCGIIGGYNLAQDSASHPGAWLVAVSEKRTKEEIDMLIEKAVEA